MSNNLMQNLDFLSSVLIDTIVFTHFHILFGKPPLNMAVNHMESDRTGFWGDGSIKFILNVPHPSGYGGKVVHYSPESIRS